MASQGQPFHELRIILLDDYVSKVVGDLHSLLREDSTLKLLVT
jgi:hypothetical protein